MAKGCLGWEISVVILLMILGGNSGCDYFWAFSVGFGWIWGWFLFTASLLLLFCLGLHFTNVATTTDTIRPDQSLTTSDYIQSANGKFGLWVSFQQKTQPSITWLYSTQTTHSMWIIFVMKM
jgi:hypothetical protein